jgi:cytosine/adenosine deaminase-related metal-dependent hydrolase
MSLSAHVVVIKDEEILLIQRADFKIWVCPAWGAALSGN